MTIGKFARMALCFVFAGPSAISITHAQTLNANDEAAFFSKCYSHLTRKRVPSNHPILLSILQNSKSGETGCIDLFNSALFRADGTLVQNTPEARDILKSFFDYQRSWFSILGIKKVALESCPKTREIHDETEPALFFLRAAFNEQAPFKEVVTLQSGVFAIRSQGAASADHLIAGTTVVTVGSNNTTYASAVTSVPTVQLGDLMGVAPMIADSAKRDAVHWIGPQPPAPNPTRTPVPGPKDGLLSPVHQHFGGGLLGAQGFLLTNLGLLSVDARRTSNGGTAMNRQFAKSVFKDLLCHEIPNIRVEDTINFVEPVGGIPGVTAIGTPQPPYRVGQSCMQCHASMDPLAAVARNLWYERGAFGCLEDTSTPRQAKGSLFVRTTKIDRPREGGLVWADSDFYRRPPNGRLLFRSYTGKLISIPINGIAELGNTLANSPDFDDFYVCTASKYYKYFTGLEVNLQDPQSAPPLSESQKAAREEVILLGKQLKQHQNLSRTIRDILGSATYRNSK